MSRFDEPQFEPLLEQLRAHIRKEQYGRCARFSYPYAARSFLRHLEHRGRTVGSVTPEDLERYLRSLRLKRRRGPFPKQFRRMHRAAIKMLLRVIRGKWPPDAIPRTPEQIEDRQIVDAYEAWMRDLRGLSSETRRHSRRETYRLLSWMPWLDSL